MIPPNIELRLRHLEDNIKQDWELLREYEEALRYEDEPRRKAKYNREINNLRESANRYEKEYDELKTQIHGESSPQMQNVAIQLQQINTSLADFVGWVEERNPTNSLSIILLDYLAWLSALVLGCTSFNPTYFS